MMDDSLQQLLLNLKTVVEGLLSCQVPNIWNIYGALNRLHRVIEKIFKHEFRIYKQNVRLVFILLIKDCHKMFIALIDL